VLPDSKGVLEVMMVFVIVSEARSSQLPARRAGGPMDTAHIDARQKAALIGSLQEV
jgi:hypothetical protein